MSNLATMIMEGSMGVSGRLKHTYGHEDGAALIAMESAEALRDIFEAEFYVPNTCTIKAAMEGASCVEESSQAAIMEASIKGAFQKIKEFFIKLKDKVVAFLHQIKRYLLGVFGNDVKWVTTYEKELNALKSSDLDGYEVKMYNYDDRLDITKSAAPSAQDLINKVKGYMTTMVKAVETERGSSNEYDEERLDEEFKKLRDDHIKGILGKTVDDDELDKELWSMYRGGADNESDKETIKVYPNIKKFIKTIKDSETVASAYEHCISKVKTEYDKCVKFVNDAEKNVDSLKMEDGAKTLTINGEKNTGGKNGVTSATVTETGRSNYVKLLRKLSSAMSTQQTVCNKNLTASKAAFTERNKAYKKALAGAFGYARKNKKK